MKRKHSFLVLLFFVVGCHVSHPITGIDYKGYAVGKESKVVDSSLLTMLRPYADSVNKTMNQVLAVAAVDLRKELPNSPLGNFLADAYRWAAIELLQQKADIAFMNHGGVRINRLAAGPLTRGNVYEVMPFDNQLVVMEITGKLLQEYLNDIAASGGGGGISGLSMRIVGKTATDVLIGGVPIDQAKTYTMVNSDYLVDGGGGFTAFKYLPQQRSGYLQRDAIIEYCRFIAASGKKVHAEPLIRISQ